MFLCGLLLGGRCALGYDVAGVQPAALDQPRINAAITLGPINTGTLLTADFGGGFVTFNIEAFFDTGASGVLISNNTADFLGIQRAMQGNQSIVFSDVGVVGSSDFNVSQPIHINLAGYTPGLDLDNPATYQSVYTQSFGNIRAQIGPLGVESDPILGDLDVFGVPLMQNKVVVMNPRPVNTFVNTMRTNVYNTGAPEIPNTSLHISLSKGDFSPFTQVTPSGAEGPTLNGNPFIGKDPTHPNDPGPPPISLSYGGSLTTGNFLLDTGAAASMISTSLAANLGITYDENSETPILIRNGQPVPDQFTLTIGGIGGTTKVAGFFLESMTVPTVEGLSNSANNIHFDGAPVLVTDITVRNPTTNGTLTLDGIFGMNFLVASANIIEGEPLPTISALSRGAFDNIVYDDFNQTLGLQPAAVIPEFIPLTWFAETDQPTEPANWDKTSPFWFDIEAGGFGDFVPFQDGDDVEFAETSFFITSGNIVVTTPVAPNSIIIDSSGYPFVFSGFPIVGTASLVKFGTATATFNNQNTYTGLTDIEEGTIVFAASQDIGPVLVNAGGGLIMQASQHFNGLNLVGGRARLIAGGNKVLRTTSLEISGAGQFDMTDNKIIIEDKAVTTPTDVRKMLKAGRSNGAWNGPGLMSSTVAPNAATVSIGYADNAEIGLTSFGGQPVDGQSLLIGVVFNGDSNLDGRVDLTDLRALATHWNTVDSFWYEGDFNYDGLVDATDLGMLSRSWQQGVAAGGAQLSLSDAAVLFGLPQAAIPEPIALSSLAIGMVFGRRPSMSRRRRATII